MRGEGAVQEAKELGKCLGIIMNCVGEGVEDEGNGQWRIILA